MHTSYSRWVPPGRRGTAEPIFPILLLRSPTKFRSCRISRTEAHHGMGHLRAELKKVCRVLPHNSPDLRGSSGGAPRVRPKVRSIMWQHRPNASVSPRKCLIPWWGSVRPILQLLITPIQYGGHRSLWPHVWRVLEPLPHPGTGKFTRA